MLSIRYEIDLNYDVQETEGPTFEEINKILQCTNEAKASSGIIKP